MEGKNQNFNFTKPFIIYRIESEKALVFARKMVKFLLTTFSDIKEIYIEKPEEVNLNEFLKTKKTK